MRGSRASCISVSCERYQPRVFSAWLSSAATVLMSGDKNPASSRYPRKLVASGTQRGGIPAATDNYLREVQRHAPPSERENSAQLLAPSSGKLADGVGPSFIRAELLAAQNGGTSRRSKRQRQDTCHSGWFHTTEVRHSAWGVQVSACCVFCRCRCS